MVFFFSVSVNAIDYEGWESVQKTCYAIENSSDPRIFLGMVSSQQDIDEIVESLDRRVLKIKRGEIQKSIREIKLGDISGELVGYFFVKVTRLRDQGDSEKERSPNLAFFGGKLLLSKKLKFSLLLLLLLSLFLSLCLSLDL